MSQRFSRKQLKHDEFVEAAFDFGHWIEKHWKSVVTWLAVAVMLVLAVSSWLWMAQQRKAAIAEQLAVGLRHFEQAQSTAFTDDAALADALLAFDEVGQKASGETKDVARYYQAATLRRLGRPDEALARIDGLDGAQMSGTIGGVLELLRANLYVENGRSGEAVTLLSTLAEASDGPLPADQALLELASLYWDRGELEEAEATWNRLVESFPDSVSAGEARRRLAS